MEANNLPNEEHTEKTYSEYSSSNVEDIENKLLDLSNNLFNGGINFVKWTTTISIAAIIWIATLSNSQGHHNILIGVSFLFFALSIVTAIAVVYFVLRYQAIQMQSCYDLLNFLITRREKEKESPHLIHPRTLYYFIQHQVSENKLSYFKDPKNFIQLIILHMVLLGFGLFFYVGYYEFL